MPQYQRGKNLENWNRGAPSGPANQIRIIGGTYGGRTIRWSGDLRTRPMKDNIREALFNLIGGWIEGRHAFDLFAGTGAIGLEAISRGAVAATLIERHFPTARIIKENIATLDPSMPAEIVKSDTFFWVRQFVKPDFNRPKMPWVVFCSPPWNLFERRTEEMMTLVESMVALAPPESVFVVEADESFDIQLLPEAESWRVRHYSPALICVLRPGPESSATPEN
jgi:16S rRNA (guanine(966)-N(2))-methyltransferase RsmD